MSFEEFEQQKYILADGQVLRLVCDFEQSQIHVRLNIRKWVGQKTEPCVLDILFNGTKEIDLVNNFDVSSYSDVVFVKTGSGDYYASLDPFGNSGQPHESDNFVIKSSEVVIFEG